MVVVMATVKSSTRAKPTRRERAQATRRRITKAAYSLFCERGYLGTTMGDVGEAAGVAVLGLLFFSRLPGEEAASAATVVAATSLTVLVEAGLYLCVAALTLALPRRREGAHSPK